VVLLLGLSTALAVVLAYRMGVQGSPEQRPVQHLATRIDDAIFPNRQIDLRSLTRSEELIQVALGAGRPDNPKVSLVLETARRIFGADIVYVQDKAGTVVSCTRYEGGKTLTGNSYAFRPYFLSALRGRETVYPAMGVTTGLRGLYFSTPISLPDRGIVGVLVVKASLDGIDAILAADPQPVFLISPDGVIFASNRKDLLFHYVKPMKPEELERIRASQQFGLQELKPFTDLFTGMRTVSFQGEPWTVSRRPILSDWTIVALAKGGPAYVVNENLVFAAAGVLGAMLVIIAVLASVIRAREKAEASLRESERKLRHAHGIQSLILGNSTVGIAFIKRRIFEWVNSRMSVIYGLPQEVLQGCPTRIIYASDEAFLRVGREAHPAMQGGGLYEAEVLCVRPDGTTFWSQILGKALDPADPEEGSIWIFDDITARKRTENELRIYREHLEELVERRTTELREAKETAEAATEAKSIFLASMSHELRTPLNAILGYAQLLTRTAGDPESRDNLQRIHKAGEHLLGLINHVLSLAKIEAGKLTLEPQPFSTELFFKSIEDLTRIRAVAKGLDFRLEVRRPFPEVLVGDSLKLRQILVNLLGNAMKFTRQGGVGLLVERVDAKVRFTVRDSGSGMSPEEVRQLFHAFQQTQSGREAAEGSGLGLHISQAMVRLMGGLIEVESEVGRGSVFRFEIPMAEDQLPPEEPERPPLDLAPGQPALRMLVVDDVEDNRTLLVRMLTGLGMEVREAEDGPSALALWEAWRPHALWMDLRMPGMDGNEAVERIRAREAELGLPRTVVIALTASVLDLELDPAWKNRFDDLMAKPFPESELVDKLHRHCGLEMMRAAPVPRGLDEVELALRIEGLDPAWVKAFEQTLVVGDRAEAQELVDTLPDRPLAEFFAQQLKGFRFEPLRRLIAPRRPHV
jgi:PAS domain S-box-containing protein